MIGRWYLKKKVLTCLLACICLVQCAHDYSKTKRDLLTKQEGEMRDADPRIWSGSGNCSCSHTRGEEKEKKLVEGWWIYIFYTDTIYNPISVIFSHFLGWCLVWVYLDGYGLQPKHSYHHQRERKPRAK